MVGGCSVEMPCGGHVLTDISIHPSPPTGLHWFSWRTWTEGKSWRPWPSGASRSGPWGEGSTWTTWPCWGTWKAWHSWTPRPGWWCGGGRTTRREGESGADQESQLERLASPWSWPHTALCIQGERGEKGDRGEQVCAGGGTPKQSLLEPVPAGTTSHCLLFCRAEMAFLASLDRLALLAPR